MYCSSKGIAKDLNYQVAGVLILHCWDRHDILDLFIYSVVDLKRYRKATSYCRSVQLLGYTVGSVLGQLLVSFNLMSYNNILVLTLVLTGIANLTSCLLPMPQQSMFFHRRQTTATEGAKRHVDGIWDATEHKSRAKMSQEEIGDEVVVKGETEDGAGAGLDEKGPKAEDLEESLGAESCGKVLLQLWRDFRHCYSSRQLLYWSVWWAMATCGYNQTVNYVQVGCECNINQSENLKAAHLLCLDIFVKS